MRGREGGSKISACLRNVTACARAQGAGPVSDWLPARAQEAAVAGQFPHAQCHVCTLSCSGDAQGAGPVSDWLPACGQEAVAADRSPCT